MLLSYMELIHGWGCWTIAYFFFYDISTSTLYKIQHATWKLELFCMLTMTIITSFFCAFPGYFWSHLMKFWFRWLISFRKLLFLSMISSFPFLLSQLFILVLLALSIARYRHLVRFSFSLCECQIYNSFSLWECQTYNMLFLVVGNHCHLCSQDHV